MPRIVALDSLQQFAAINVTSDPGAIPGKKKITSCAEVVLYWTLEDGKQAHNVLIGRYSGAFHGTQAECTAIGNALTGGTQWTALATFLAPTTSFVGVSLRDINTVDNPIIFAAQAKPGTSTSAALPNEVAAVITTRTAFVGPANRGRVYVPGWATNALGTGNVIAAGAVTALTNWGSIIAGALSGSGYTWCVGHVARQAYTGSSGTAHPARSDGSVPITTTEVRDNHWDTVRRRGLK